MNWSVFLCCLTCDQKQQGQYQISEITCQFYIMSQSRLSQVMGICELVQSMSEEECLHTFELIRQELGCDNTNQLLIKIFVRASNVLFTNDTLEKISTKIQDKNNTKPKEKDKCNNSKQRDNVLFPLLNLPIDLISDTLLFLKEQDICIVELCNRLLYKVVNTLSFLKKSRNFKKFQLNNQMLDKVVIKRYGFYKYSVADYLVFDLDSSIYLKFFNGGGMQSVLDSWIENTRKSLCNAVCLNSHSDDVHVYEGSRLYQNMWFNSMLKSIKTLQLSSDSMYFIDLLPIEYLFNKNESNLECLGFSLYWGNKIDSLLKQFDNKYLEYVSHCGGVSNVKALKLVQCSGHKCRIKYAKYFNASHLYLYRSKIVLNCYFQDATKYRPNLKALTFRLSHDICLQDKIQLNSKLSIESLTLIDTTRGCPEMNLLTNSYFIDILNFANTLKNLTFHTKCNISIIANTIKSIIKKEYLYNLERVNILFDCAATMTSSRLTRLYYKQDEFGNVSMVVSNDPAGYWIQIFDKMMIYCNDKLFKHQFKQFNIGLFVDAKQVGAGKIFDTFSWNKNIAIKDIKQTKEKWNEKDVYKHQTKYMMWKTQWSHKI